MKPAQDRIFWVDSIRALSIFLVIIIHFSPGVLTNWQNPPSFSWWIVHAFDSFARISVPLFVLVSGGLLLGKMESLKNFFSKRFNRVFLPWLVWLGITFLAEIFLFQNSAIVQLSYREFFSQFIKNSFWFIPLLLELYFLTPFLRIFVQHFPKKLLWIFSLAYIVIVGIIDACCRIGGICFSFYAPIVFQYLGLFVLGYLLIQFPKKVLYTRLASVAWIIGWLVTLSGTFLISRYQGSFSEAVYQYISLPVVLSAVSAFLVIKNTSDSWARLFSPTTKKMISQLGQASLGIFLCHGLLIKLISISPLQSVLSLAVVFPLLGIPLLSLFILFLSYATVAPLKRFFVRLATIHLS